MTAGEFLSRAEPIMRESQITLMFSPGAHALMKTVGEAAQHLRAAAEADRASGKRVSTCLPPKGKARVDSKELVAYLRTLTPAQRAQSFDQAFAGYAARKYPCA